MIRSRASSRKGSLSRQAHGARFRRRRRPILAGVKLVVAIVNPEDAGSLVDALLERDYRATRLHSSGGFLKQSNATVILGVDDDAVEGVLGIIRESCHSRTQLVNPMPPILEPGEFFLPYPLEVEVGGARSSSCPWSGSSGCSRGAGGPAPRPRLRPRRSTPRERPDEPSSPRPRRVLESTATGQAVSRSSSSSGAPPAASSPGSGSASPAAWSRASGSRSRRLREVREEIGFGPDEIEAFYDLDQVTQFYDEGSDAIVTGGHLRRACRAGRRARASPTSTMPTGGRPPRSGAAHGLADVPGDDRADHGHAAGPPGRAVVPAGPRGATAGPLSAAPAVQSPEPAAGGTGGGWQQRRRIRIDDADPDRGRGAAPLPLEGRLHPARRMASRTSPSPREPRRSSPPTSRSTRTSRASRCGSPCWPPPWTPSSTPAAPARWPPSAGSPS